MKHGFTRRDALLASLASAAPSFTLAQAEFPSKPITFVVPYPPGGSQDTMARLFGQHLSEELKQPVIVQNKPGAGGAIGCQFVAQSPADGYTMVITSNGPLTILPFMTDAPAYRHTDFAPVFMFFTAPFFLVVPASSPFKNAADLIARGRQKDRPALTFGTTGNGTMSHLSSEMINRSAGTSFIHVPYKGGAPLTLALISAETDWALQQAADAKSQVDAGKIRPIAVLSPERSAPWPDVPTLKELGIGGLETLSWSGLLAPARTPRPVIARVNAVLSRILLDPAIDAKLRSTGVVPGLPNNTPAGFASFLDAEARIFGKAVREIGLRAG
jgi:tripartite-type tricarboxylate transporter receptor subunit TctC